jgi:AbrB family looped-hinge helix DNA binding protein
MEQSIAQSLYGFNQDDCVVSEMDTVTISPKYQVVIPKSVRDKLDLEPGQKVMVTEWDGIVHLVPVPTVDEAYGALPGLDTRVPREPDRL